MGRYRLAVVGAGAAGLLAACQAARRLGPGAVALLEGTPKPGKKLLATGNGRCNLTNLHIAPGHYHGDVGLAQGLLAAYPARRVIEAFGGLGLRTWVDGEGRVYPHSLQAAAVLQALWGGCEEQGISFFMGSPVEGITSCRGGFLLALPGGRDLWAEKCLLACGGVAAPKHGCGAGGYGLAKGLGHTVTPLRPGLAPLVCPKKLTAPLKGMRCKARASLRAGGRVVYSESGEVIFGEGGLSGICIFNLSLRLEGAGEVALDLVEDMGREELLAYFRRLQSQRPGLPARDIFSGLVNLRVGQQRAKALGFVGDMPLSAVPGQGLRRAVAGVKEWVLPVSPCQGWDSAQVTVGGVPLAEVDMATMESKKQPGLYLAGELLDIHGDCGGYNLHWAWATGLAAGEAASR